MDLMKASKKMHLVIGNSGVTASTTEVVADVRRLKGENPEKFEKIFKEYKILAEEAKKALVNGNIVKIGKLMNENHHLLKEITVSGEINELLVDMTLQAGALGAKMTGTGRGGLVIAVAENEESQLKISKAIENKGYDAWKTMIG